MKVVMKMEFEPYSPIATISGILSMLTIDGIINSYLMLITIICGTISIAKIIIRLITIIRDYIKRKKTARETLKNLDELEEEIKHDIK